MLRIEIKPGENIERALKRYKNKYRKTQQLKNIRSKNHFVKPSQLRREEIAKAVYKQAYEQNSDQ